MHTYADADRRVCTHVRVRSSYAQVVLLEQFPSDRSGWLARERGRDQIVEKG